MTRRYPQLCRAYRLPYRNSERGNNAGQIGSTIGIIIGIAVIIAFPELAPFAALIIGAGGLVGGAAGTLYDSATAKDHRQEQQSLSDLKITTSTYGQIMPQYFGAFGGNAGNVFWSTDKIEHIHEDRTGGKGLGGGGGATVTVTKTYTVSMAIALADTRLTGPMVLDKVWRDLSLMVDASLPETGGGSTFNVVTAGNGYAVGDTGGIGGGDFNMGYIVTITGVGGALVSADLLNGTGYAIGTDYPLNRGGAQAGNGNGATIQLVSLVSQQIPFNWTFYSGTADQLPDPTMEALGNGGISTFDLTAPGADFAVGDTGNIAGGTLLASYVVDTVVAGEITALTLTDAGTGYVVGQIYQLAAGGAQPGNGSGAEITVTALAGGVNEVPGYRYTCYIMIKDDELGQVGAVHNYTFALHPLITRQLADVVALYCDAAGIDAAHRLIEVPTIVADHALVSMQAIRAPLHELMQDFRFYVAETGRKLRFRTIGAGDLMFAISENDVDVGEERSPLRGVMIERNDEVLLPTDFDITYIDAAMNWQHNTQRTHLALQTGSLEAPRTRSTTTVLTSAYAKKLSQELAYEAWVQNEALKVPVGRKYAAIEPGDRGTITARGVSYGVVVAETTYGRPGIMELTALIDAGFVRDAVAPAPGIGAVPAWANNLALRLPTTAHLLNLPSLHSSDVLPRYHVGYQSDSAPWPGAVLARSTDNEASYQEIDSAVLQTTGGIVAIATPGADPHVLDTTTVIEVVLDYGSLTSIDDLALYNGRNAVALVDAAGNTIEILCFGTATLVAPHTYELSRLLRGRRGTEWGVGLHGANERLIVLSSALHEKAMPMWERNVSFPYKCATIGLPIFSAAVQEFTATAANLVPWSVAQAAAEQSGADWVFTWWYRSRFTGDWSDSTGIGFDNDFNGFAISFFADATYAVLVSTYLVDGGNPLDPEIQKNWTYSSSDQTVDFGAPQATLYYRIQQVSNSNDYSVADDLVAA